MNKETQNAEMTWSLITVTYNSAESLGKFWSGVSLPADVEWIVVDNDSTDNSVAIATQLGAHVIRLPRNIGFGAANNRGFAVCSGQYVCFINPDVKCNAADFRVLQSILVRHPSDLIAPQLLNSDGSLQPNGRGKPYLWVKILHRLHPKLLEGSYRHYAHPGRIEEVSWLTGACVCARRERFSALGPWDEHFFVYYEDSDLGLRNAMMGGRSFVIGDVRWMHGWRRETTGLSMAAWRHEIASMVKFYVRYSLCLTSTRGGRRVLELSPEGGFVE